MEFHSILMCRLGDFFFECVWQIQTPYSNEADENFVNFLCENRHMFAHIEADIYLYSVNYVAHWQWFFLMRILIHEITGMDFLLTVAVFITFSV